MTNSVPLLTLKAPRKTASRADGRRGDVFSVRLEDDERAKLGELHTMARPEMPWRPHRHDSLGAFVVWAALRWKPAQQVLVPAPRSKRKKPAKPRRRGTTRRPGRRRPTSKKGRRS